MATDKGGGLTYAQAGVDIDHFIELARIAERGKFDMLFVEDAAAIRERNPEMASQAARSTAFEPLSLLAALAVNTSHIGLVATASTSYNEPYGLARTFASLDQLSGGRAGWNLVTSASELEAENFASSGLRPHSERYERAEEFADAALALWDGVDDGAYFPERGARFADRTRLHPVHRRGKHFTVEGLLESPRSAQGRPIMVQAGASDVGKELAARTLHTMSSRAEGPFVVINAAAITPERMEVELFGVELSDRRLLADRGRRRTSRGLGNAAEIWRAQPARVLADGEPWGANPRPLRRGWHPGFRHDRECDCRVRRTR